MQSIDKIIIEKIPANEGGGFLSCGSGHLVKRADPAGLSKGALSGCQPRKLCWFPADFIQFGSTLQKIKHLQ